MFYVSKYMHINVCYILVAYATPIPMFSSKFGSTKMNTSGSKSPLHSSTPLQGRVAVCGFQFGCWKHISCDLCVMKTVHVLYFGYGAGATIP